MKCAEKAFHCGERENEAKNGDFFCSFFNFSKMLQRNSFFMCLLFILQGAFEKVLREMECVNDLWINLTLKVQPRDEEFFFMKNDAVFHVCGWVC